MMRYDDPLSPILLALVISDGDFAILFSCPIAVGLMVLAVFSLVLAIKGAGRSRPSCRSRKGCSRK